MMNVVRVVSYTQDAIAIIDGTLPKLTNLLMRENLYTVRAYVVEAQKQEERWHTSYDVARADEPKAVKQALDEARFFWSIRDLMRDDSEHQAQRQFHDRALASIMALMTRRYITLQGAGRVTGDMRDASNEEWAMWHGFEYARLGYGSSLVTTRGAAIEDAYRIGLKGGTWASHILDGRP